MFTIMKHLIVSVSVATVCFVKLLDGYPSGAGISACSTLKPQHEDALEPSEYTSPYSVQIEDDTRTYSYGEPITGMFNVSSFFYIFNYLSVEMVHNTGKYQHRQFACFIPHIFSLYNCFHILFEIPQLKWLLLVFHGKGYSYKPEGSTQRERLVTGTNL